MRDKKISTLHDILRDRLERRAGLGEVCEKFKSLDEIYKMQWNPDFERFMRNRLAMGYFRYGSLQKSIGKNLYDNIGSIRKRLELYEKTKNREHLVDCANLCLVEFTVNPQHPFNPIDDGHHTAKNKNRKLA